MRMIRMQVDCVAVPLNDERSRISLRSLHGGNLMLYPANHCHHINQRKIA